MQRACGSLMCRLLVACAAAAVAAVAPAGAAAFRDMATGADALRAARAANGMVHAFLYADGTLTALNDPDALDDLIDPAPDWDIADAALLDDVGRIAATACRGSPCEAVRRHAMPALVEPSALALLGAGVALLGWRRRQAWGFTPLAPRCPG